MAKIHLKRANAFRGKFRCFEIWLNNEKIDYLKNAENKSIELKAGSHHIYIQCSPFGKSREFSFTARDEEEVVLEAGFIESSIDKALISSIGFISVIAVNIYKPIAKTLGVYAWTPLIVVLFLIGVIAFSCIYYHKKETLYLRPYQPGFNADDPITPCE